MLSKCLYRCMHRIIRRIQLTHLLFLRILSLILTPLFLRGFSGSRVQSSLSGLHPLACYNLHEQKCAHEGRVSQPHHDSRYTIQSVPNRVSICFVEEIARGCSCFIAKLGVCVCVCVCVFFYRSSFSFNRIKFVYFAEGTWAFRNE